MKKLLIAATVFSMSFLLAGGFLGLAGPETVLARESQVKKEGNTVVGKLKEISKKAKIITIDRKGKGFFIVKINDKTVFKNAKDITSLKASEKVKVQYIKIGAENIALKVERVLVKLPKGVKEIKTPELEALLKKADQKLVLIDARPHIKYRESHIAGAVSLPYSKLKKVSKSKEKGLKLLSYPKDAHLIFYCGGET
jgi:predicted sulfurtransferase